VLSSPLRTCASHGGELPGRYVDLTIERAWSGVLDHCSYEKSTCCTLFFSIKGSELHTFLIDLDLNFLV